MQKFTRNLYGILAVSALFTVNNSKAQCSVTSSSGYNVSISAMPVSVIAPSDCPWGYNYNVTLSYIVSFSGSNVPSNLYTLQGNIYCGGQANFFNLPVTGGSGLVTTGSNPYRNTTDCAGATVNSLHCTSVQINIEGPGIVAQTINCNASGPLPVSLTSFNGRLVNNNSVYLKWETSGEVNNRSFTIERSKDAVNWQAIKTIAGAGNSGITRQYDYTDEGLLNGTWYYRLKQTDLSGAYTYSNVIGANVTRAKAKEIAVLYDPSNQLRFSGLGNSSEWELAVFNSASGLVSSSSSLKSSVVQLPVLTTGLYYARLRNKVSGTVTSLKFINK